jgi:hypothetical protein
MLVRGILLNLRKNRGACFGEDALGKLPRRMFLSVGSPNRSSRRPQQRSDVGDRPEVRQLVGVDDPADARDPTAGLHPS